MVLQFLRLQVYSKCRRGKLTTTRARISEAQSYFQTPALPVANCGSSAKPHDLPEAGRSTTAQLTPAAASQGRPRVKGGNLYETPQGRCSKKWQAV